MSCYTFMCGLLRPTTTCYSFRGLLHIHMWVATTYHDLSSLCVFIGCILFTSCYPFMCELLQLTTTQLSPAITCHHLLPLVTTCYDIPRHATTCYDLLSFAMTCYELLRLATNATNCYEFHEIATNKQKATNCHKILLINEIVENLPWDST